MPSPTTAALFKINNVTIAEVANATVNLTQTSIDVTSIGATYKAFEYGFPEGTIELELFYDSADHSAIPEAIENGNFLTGAEVVWASGKSIKGNAIVESVAISVAPNGVAQANVTLRFANSAITVVG